MLLVALLQVLPVHSSPGLMLIGPNVDIVSELEGAGRQQVEPTIAVDPTNPSILVAGAQDLRLKAEGEHRWHGYYRSTDGGDSWSSSLLPGFPGDTSVEGSSSPLLEFDATTDPVLAFDNLGNVFYAGVAIRLTPSFESRVFVARYTDHGATYHSTVLIDLVGMFDKEWVVVDTSGTPESDGNIYLVWQGIVNDVAQGRFTTFFSKSTDHGATFSRPSRVGPGVGLLPFVTVDPLGNVYVSTVNSGLEHILVSRSTDGGLSFQTFRAAKITPVRALPDNSFRVLTVPQLAANEHGVYLVWDDFGTKDADVLFSRSSDGGRTWSRPTRVNDVPTNHQFFPSLAVSGGRVSIVWYDSRLDDGGTITRLDVYYAYSTDHGTSFSTNQRLTTTSFDPNLVPRTDFFTPDEPFLGDYIHIATGPTSVHPVWTDNRNACDNIDPDFGCVDQDIFTTTITLDS